jgi:hypothetical protein
MLAKERKPDINSVVGVTDGIEAAHAQVLAEENSAECLIHGVNRRLAPRDLHWYLPL